MPYCEQMDKGNVLHASNPNLLILAVCHIAAVDVPCRVHTRLLHHVARGIVVTGDADCNSLKTLFLGTELVRMSNIYNETKFASM